MRRLSVTISTAQKTIEIGTIKSWKRGRMNFKWFCVRSVSDWCRVYFALVRCIMQSAQLQAIAVRTQTIVKSKSEKKMFTRVFDCRLWQSPLFLQANWYMYVSLFQTFFPSYLFTLFFVFVFKFYDQHHKPLQQQLNIRRMNLWTYNTQICIKCLFDFHMPNV